MQQVCFLQKVAKSELKCLTGQSVRGFMQSSQGLGEDRGHNYPG